MVTVVGMDFIGSDSGLKIKPKIFLLHCISVSSPHSGWCSKIKTQFNSMISHIISGFKLRISFLFSLGLTQAPRANASSVSVERGQQLLELDLS